MNTTVIYLPYASINPTYILELCSPAMNHSLGDHRIYPILVTPGPYGHPRCHDEGPRSVAAWGQEEALFQFRVVGLDLLDTLFTSA